MHVHAGAQHDFTGDIGCSRHLYHLTKYQLFDNFRGDFATGQHFTHDHFTEVDGRHAVKRGRLSGKRGT